MNSVLYLVLSTVFWASLLGLAHTYVIYPLLMPRLRRWKERHQNGPRPVFTADDADSEWPYLVVAMAAHNEEAVIEATLTSIFATEYPAARFEVLIAADNCSDRTHEFVERFQRSHPNLTLRIFPGRNGKIRCLNQLVAENRHRLAHFGDYVFILCDANVRWAKTLPRELARHFRDPRVGQVAANVLDGRREHHGIADEEEAYINRENEVKRAEGVVWGRMMGAVGACFAMRGSLFREVPENFRSDDFTHTMHCFESGYDAIVAPRAVCYEDVSEDIAEEFARKRRIAIGNLQNFTRFWRLFLPWRGGFGTSFAFWSHKGLRWFGPFLLCAAFVSSLLLAPQHPVFALALAGQIGLLGAAVLDAALTKRGVHLRLPRFARYFLLMNLALMLGTLRFFRGEETAFWEPTRRVNVTPSSPPAPSSPPRPSNPEPAVSSRR